MRGGRQLGVEQLGFEQAAWQRGWLAGGCSGACWGARPHVRAIPRHACPPFRPCSPARSMMEKLWGDNFFDPATKKWTNKVCGCRWRSVAAAASCSSVRGA